MIINIIARIVGVCRVSLGNTAIIAWIVINKGTEARIIKAPIPKIPDATKPIRSLALADVKVDGNCVTNSKLNDMSNNIIKVVTGTIIWDKSCKKIDILKLILH